MVQQQALRDFAQAMRKVDPSVQYLGPGYERALFTYYFRLWRNRPTEMASIYRRKLAVTRQNAEEFLSSTGSGLFWPRKDGRWLTVAAWPALRIADVVGVGGLFAALLTIGCVRPGRLDIDHARGFCLAAIAIAGFLGFVESAVVLSGVILWYSSVYLFALVFTGLFIYQSTLDACWGRRSMLFWGAGAVGRRHDDSISSSRGAQWDPNVLERRLAVFQRGAGRRGVLS